MSLSALTSERGQRLLAFALLFLITLPMLTKIFTSDYGTHLAMGRQIVETRSIPDKEFLNYPSLGMDNPNGEWGFQAVLWLVHSAGGDYAVSFMVWAVVFGIFLMLHRATTLRGAHPLVAVAALFAFSGFLRIRIQPRPEIFTYLFTAATIYMFSEFYFGERKKLIYGFPVMLLVWANMHPTYLMAFILACAFAGERFLHALFKGELDIRFVKEKLLPPVVVTLLAMATCGFNPHGWDALLLPLHLISRSSGGGSGSNQVLMSISELTPVRETGFFIYYKAAAWFAAVTIAMGIVGRRLQLLDLALFAIAFKGSWDSARAVSMMGLFLSPGASLQMTGFIEAAGRWFAPASPLKAKESRPQKQGAGAPSSKPASAGPPAAPTASVPTSTGRSIVAAALVLFLVGFGGLTLSFSFSQLEFGVGVTEHKFSFKAGEFLRQLPIKGNMFNFFDIGGFLDWQLYPGKLTFIDGRTYNSAIFMEHQIGTGAMTGWERNFAKHGITYVVLKTMDSSGMILPLVSVLANRPEWALIFADGLFVVFARDIPENAEIIRKYALPKNTTIPQQIIQESYHYMYLGISPLLAYMTIADMYEVLGNRAGAIEALRKGADAAGNDPQAAVMTNRLLQLQGGGGFR